MTVKRSLIWKAERPWPNERMGTASIVGHTTDTTARIWVRTGRLGRFRLLWWSKPDGTSSPPGWVHKVPLPLNAIPASVNQSDPLDLPNWNSDTTHVFDLTGLTPDVEYAYALYWYGIHDANTRIDEPARIYLGHDMLRFFRTMPDPGSKEPVNFALYSCHKPFKKDKHGKDFEVVNDHMWTLFHEALERHSGRFTEWIESAAEKKRYESLRCVIGGGDQVYSDGDGAPNIWELLDQRMHRSGNRLYPSSDEMKVWYRDIYRGYWGFKRLQQVYANYPNYMIWDDHELHDGWGSHKMSVDKVVRSQFLNYRPKAKNLKAEHARALIKRMIRAGAEVYNEYQHAHNPATPNEKQWDYHFEIGPVAVYVLDGRGHRNIERTDAKILGRQQLSRFKHWLGSPAVAAKEFVYVVSAVPVFHLRSLLGTTKFQKFLKLVRADGVLDDLRDHWEDDVHDDERCELLEALFDAAGKGARISILSGDVHVAAAFKLSDDSGNVIYQLTSSAITWNLSRLKGIALKLGVPEAGICEVKTGRGKNKKVRFRHHFERLALYARSNFAIVRSDPQTGEATFQLYGDPDSRDPINEVDSRYERELMDEGYDLVRSHAMARIPLRF